MFFKVLGHSGEIRQKPKFQSLGNAIKSKKTKFSSKIKVPFIASQVNSEIVDINKLALNMNEEANDNLEDALEDPNEA